MKNKSTIALKLSFVLITLFTSYSLVSQTSLQAQESYKKQHINDDKFLKGFEEDAIRADLKKKGLNNSEVEGIVNARKATYISLQKGIKRKPYFAKKDPSKLLTPSGCPNAGFEDSTFTNWTGGTGDCSFFPAPTVFTPGLVSGPMNDVETDANSQQDILTDPLGYDLVCGLTGGVPNIPYLAPGGGGVSVRLGNEAVNSGTEYLKYAINVTPTNTSFTYQYAVVLQNPDSISHNWSQQPRFTITVYDQNNTPISGPCGAYSVQAADAASDPSYLYFQPPASASDPTLGGYYKPWTTVSIDLSPYVGTTVSIEFVTQDCSLGGHFGYAYIDATCSQLQSQVAFCPTDTILLLTAPGGFVSYQWYDSTLAQIPASLGGTNDSLWIVHPVIGSHYTVNMFSAAGCGSSLTTTLSYSQMTLFHNTHDITCNGLNNGWVYINQAGAIGPYTYTWTNSLGVPINPGAHPDSLVSAPAGTYYVTVQSQGGCMAMDTIQLLQPPPVDTTKTGVPICLNPPSGSFSYTLSAPSGNTEYQWYDASHQLIATGNNQTLSITNPTLSQEYTVSYVPTGGCKTWVTDTFYTYRLDQPLQFNDTTSCYGYNDGWAYVLKPISHPAGPLGAFSYSWVNALTNSTVDNDSLLNNAFAGTYYLTATSAGGCKTVDTITVNQPPNAFDSVSIVTTFCPGDAPIYLFVNNPASNSYSWYGNANATGPVLSTNDSLQVDFPIPGTYYTVVMPNPLGGAACNIIASTKLEYALPPPPPNFITNTNVFTPNGDGKNDYFLMNQSSYKYIKEFHLEVFNRWGKKVYETSDFSSQWDGKINGNKAEEGVYFWMASYSQSCLENAPTLTANGFVHLIR